MYVHDATRATDRTDPDITDRHEQRRDLIFFSEMNFELISSIENGGMPAAAEFVHMGRERLNGNVHADHSHPHNMTPSSSSSSSNAIMTDAEDHPSVTSSF